jgi:hypothetical protein
MTATKPFSLMYQQGLIIGILLLIISTLLLWLSQSAIFSVAISQILIVIAGMTTVGALSTLADSWQVEKNQQTRQKIAIDLFSILAHCLTPFTYGVSAAIDVRSNQLLNQFVGVDNALALAYLRIELEKQLRRLADAHLFGSDIDSSKGVLDLSQQLVESQVIPSAWHQVLQELISVCNQAIHGVDMSDTTTASVVLLGEQLIEQLRLLSASTTSQET